MVQVAKKLVMKRRIWAARYSLPLGRRKRWCSWRGTRSTRSFKVLTLINSFHGRTVTTLKATGQERFHNYFFPFTEGFDYAANDIKSVRAKADDMTSPS